jgi:carbon-monoxide dehydrogenase medium subunit
VQPFSYARPSTLAEAIALLADRGPDARVLAGGTDLLIRLRDGSMTPSFVVDVKRVPELAPGIRAAATGS